jgi:hypothetical protein
MWIRPVTVWLALSVLCASCSDQREMSYESLANAIAAGESTRGWMPEWLPPSSHAIKITYDPSSPSTWCTFEFSPDDVQLLQGSLTRVDVPPPSVLRIRNPGVSWWPAVLTGDLDVVELRSRGFALYTVMEPGVGAKTRTVFVAVDAAKGRGYFYRSAGG